MFLVRVHGAQKFAHHVSSIDWRVNVGAKNSDLQGKRYSESSHRQKIPGRSGFVESILPDRGGGFFWDSHCRLGHLKWRREFRHKLCRILEKIRNAGFRHSYCCSFSPSFLSLSLLSPLHSPSGAVLFSSTKRLPTQRGHHRLQSPPCDLQAKKNCPLSLTTASAAELSVLAATVVDIWQSRCLAE